MLSDLLNKFENAKITSINLEKEFKPVNKIKTCKDKLINLEVTYNRKRIFVRARYLSENKTWSESLKQSWKEEKAVILKNRAEAERLKEVLFDSHTPKQDRSKDLYKSMENAYNKGFNLNGWKM